MSLSKEGGEILGKPQTRREVSKDAGRALRVSTTACIRQDTFPEQKFMPCGCYGQSISSELSWVGWAGVVRGMQWCRELRGYLGGLRAKAAIVAEPEGLVFGGMLIFGWGSDRGVEARSAGAERSGAEIERGIQWCRAYQVGSSGLEQDEAVFRLSGCGRGSDRGVRSDSDERSVA